MNKILKIITGIIIIYLVYFFGGILIFSHSTDWKTWKQYTWIFQDSVKMATDDPLNYSNVGRNDVRNTFHYRNYEYSILVWNFKELIKLDLGKVNFNQNVNLDNLSFWAGEVFYSKTDLQTTVIPFAHQFAKGLKQDPLCGYTILFLFFI